MRPVVVALTVAILLISTSITNAQRGGGRGPGGGGRGGSGGSGGGCQRGGGGSTATFNRSNTPSIRGIYSGGSSSGAVSVAPMTYPDLRATVLTTFDANYDGKLAGDERNKLIAALRLRGYSQDYINRFLQRWAFLEQFDADGDGQINQSEAQAVRLAKTNAETAKKRGLALHRAQLLQQYDANGDGKLSMPEKLALREGVAKQTTTQ